MTVVEQIVPDFTAYPLVVEADNRVAVDQSKQVNPYLKVEIDDLAGGQADIGNHPLVEERGQLILYACIKAGNGPLLARQLLDFIIPYFDCKIINSIQCQGAYVARKQEVAGWTYLPVIFNYYYHRQSV